MVSAFPQEWQLSAVIARSVGIIAIALGFVIGMYGLDHPESHWLRTSLGLLVTGMIAQGYALCCSIKRVRHLNA
ncbi:MAG: hypothetical protein IPP12_00915 [Nitrospira sp.]|jgi:hypothetical protein|nr:hypothetical protein [Candidatus Nitrospira nitrosa]MBK8276177.1 hypothetical protein [Nitrospira sp.]MBK9945731.1 hypothetical protein [Nitrospira sp.]MBL8054170.1 hypothetical protein [Nitrospira sp.]